MISWIRLVVLGASVFLLATPAHARQQKQQEPLVDFLTALYARSVNQLFENIADNGISVNQINVQYGKPDQPQLQLLPGFDLAGNLVSAFVADLASFPLGSSSGGFIYTMEPGALGLEPVRSNASFGPAFAERPQTLGRDRSSVGVTFMHRLYDSLEGRRMTSRPASVGAELVEVESQQGIDIVISDFAARIDSSTTTFFATYGVTDRLDVAIAVPFQRVDIDATVTTSLDFYGLEIPAATVGDVASASGLGDIAVRSKFKMFESSQSVAKTTQPPAFGGAVAAGIDLRVATGDESSLLGTGNTRLKVYAAGSLTLGNRLFPHVNFGYTFPSGSKGSENSPFFFGAETSFAIGAEAVLTERLTLVGDVVGRSLANEGRMRESTTLATLFEPRTLLAFEEGATLDPLLGTVGFKFNPRSTFIVSAHLLFPMNDAGLQSRMSAVIGVDYTFGTGRIQNVSASRR